MFYFPNCFWPTLRDITFTNVVPSCGTVGFAYSSGALNQLVLREPIHFFSRLHRPSPTPSLANWCSNPFSLFPHVGKSSECFFFFFFNVQLLLIVCPHLTSAPAFLKIEGGGSRFPFFQKPSTQDEGGRIKRVFPFLTRDFLQSHSPVPATFFS